MEKNKTSEAQLRANKKWDEKNKEKKKRIVKRSHAKNYILSASVEELDQVKEWILEREKLLEEQ